MVSNYLNSIMDIYFILYYYFSPQVFFISERHQNDSAFVNQAYRLFVCDETSQNMQ